MFSFVPTGRNIDSLHFSLVETKEKMDEIRLIEDKYGYENNLIFRNATGMIAVSVNKTIAAQSCESVDPIIALSYADLYAQSHGLDTLWCGWAYNTVLKIQEIYSLPKIPEEFTLAYIMLIGIPKLNYKRTIQPEKFSMSIIK